MARRQIFNRLAETDLWCGFELTRTEKDILTYLSMIEMEKPIRQRVKYYKLVEKTRNIIKEIEFGKNKAINKLVETNTSNTYKEKSA